MSVSPGAKSFIVVVCAVLVAAMAGMVGLGFIVNTSETSNDAKELSEKARAQSEANNALLQQVKGIAENSVVLLRVILAVTGCTAEDTPEQCRQRVIDGGAVEGVSRIAEVDCRIRRALASLPAPDPGTVCTL